MIEKNNDALHAIAEKAANSASSQPGVSDVSKASPTDMQMVGDYYASGMDEQAVARPGSRRLRMSWQDRRDQGQERCAQGSGASPHAGRERVLRFRFAPDDKNSTKVIAQAFQGGLGMPDRDYYTKTDDASKKLRDQYVEHVTKMLTLLGDPADKAATDAKTILDFETSLAQAGAHPRRAARSAEELQQDDPGGAAEAHAGLELGRFLQGNRFDRSRATSMCVSPTSSRPPITLFKTVFDR